MKISTSYKNAIIDTICLLYVLLFVYAAVSKLLDFENFQVQLGQSPLLTAFAAIISWLVPFLEIVISILLCIKKYRKIGLYIGSGLMAMFTIYIYMIINFSPYIPCSCGGILQKLGWQEHLYFNIIFLFLSFLGIMVITSYKQTLIAIIFIAFFGTLIPVSLYLASENIIRKENPFVRRFLPITLNEATEVELPNHEFYFAGYEMGKVYVSNYISPLHILTYDSSLKIQEHYKISLDREDYKFRSMDVRVDSSNFYMWDGTVPVIYKGNFKDKIGKVIYDGPDYFSKASLLSDGAFAIRGQLPRSGEYLMKYLSPNDKHIFSRHKFLEKQQDGVFDTEGTLQYSKELRKFVYTYYYRNQFIVSNEKLEVIYRGNTIDTTAHSNLKIVKMEKTGDTKLAEPPITVNKGTSVYKNLLFVHSGLMGKYESDKVWHQASVIDVYDIQKNTYIFSFYVYDRKGFKMKPFIATEDGLYTISGNILQRHTWGKPVLKNTLK